MTHIKMPAPLHADGTYSAEQMQAYADARVRDALEAVFTLTAAGYRIGAADEPEQHQLFEAS